MYPFEIKVLFGYLIECATISIGKTSCELELTATTSIATMHVHFLR